MTLVDKLIDRYVKVTHKICEPRATNPLIEFFCCLIILRSLLFSYVLRALNALTIRIKPTSSELNYINSFHDYSQKYTNFQP